MKNLPPVLIKYFDAANTQDAQTCVGCFTTDAIVKDENTEHTGHKNIAAWSRTVNEKYKCKHIVQGCAHADDGMHVTAQVSGTFPGSPITLTFRFVLQDDKISMLEIV